MLNSFASSFQFGKNGVNFTKSGLILYYDPNNTDSYPGSGTSIDSLVSPNLTGTLSNVNLTAPYFDYNGANSQISIADTASLEPGSGDWTMEAWFNTTAFKTGSAGVIVGKFDAGGLSADVSYSIRANNTGVMYAQIGNGSTVVNSTNYQTVLNTWAQVVYVWQNVSTNSLETYINGSIIGSTSHSFASILNTSTNLYIGSYNGGEYSQYFNGKIGIVRLYNRALSPGEVSRNFNANKGIYGL
jgi:hypothetical protein